MEFKRKLTTILSADVVGYSRLMSDNEEETVRTLKTCRNVIESLINEHHGRLVDSPGDNILAEFPSVVNGVRCAWDIQQEIKSRNLDLSNKEKYSGMLDDVFDIQEKVSRSIVKALKVKLKANESEQLAERPIENVQAYECYMRAKQELWKFSESSLNRAICFSG